MPRKTSEYFSYSFQDILVPPGRGPVFGCISRVFCLAFGTERIQRRKGVWIRVNVNEEFKVFMIGLFAGAFLATVAARGVWQSERDRWQAQAIELGYGRYDHDSPNYFSWVK